MLNKSIYYQPKDYPKEKIIMIEDMIIPIGEYSYCQKIEEKINEYLCNISLDITLFLLEIEKRDKELYREADEFAWILHKDRQLMLNEINDPIVLDGKEKSVLLNSYQLFEPLYRQQLQNIYNFLKNQYQIDEYFTKKYAYEQLKNKLKCKCKEAVQKI